MPRVLSSNLKDIINLVERRSTSRCESVCRKRLPRVKLLLSPDRLTLFFEPLRECKELFRTNVFEFFLFLLQPCQTVCTTDFDIRRGVLQEWSGPASRLTVLVDTVENALS